MEKNYPAWVLDKRPVNVKGVIMRTEPSTRRIEDRKAIYNILLEKNPALVKIDDIINHFRERYEGSIWTGLGKKGRLELFLRYKGRCMWCTKKLKLAEFTVEHIQPRVEGGSDELDNLGVACKSCNEDRQDVLITKHGTYNDKQISKIQRGTPSPSEALG